jgi:hypothetical protein
MKVREEGWEFVQNTNEYNQHTRRHLLEYIKSSEYSEFY